MCQFLLVKNCFKEYINIITVKKNSVEIHEEYKYIDKYETGSEI